MQDLPEELFFQIEKYLDLDTLADLRQTCLQMLLLSEKQPFLVQTCQRLELPVEKSFSALLRLYDRKKLLCVENDCFLLDSFKHYLYCGETRGIRACFHQGIKIIPMALVMLVQYGNLRWINYALEHGMRASNEALIESLRMKRMDIFNHLFYWRSDSNLKYIAEYSCQHRYWKALSKCVRAGAVDVEKSLIKYAQLGELDLCKYFVRKGARKLTLACQAAEGHTQVVSYLNALKKEGLPPRAKDAFLLAGPYSMPHDLLKSESKSRKALNDKYDPLGLLVAGAIRQCEKR